MDVVGCLPADFGAPSKAVNGPREFVDCLFGVFELGFVLMQSRSIGFSNLLELVLSVFYIANAVVKLYSVVRSED